MVTVAGALAVTAGGEFPPVLPNPLTVTVSVSDPSVPVKLPVKLHRLLILLPEATVCGSVQFTPVAVPKVPAGQAGGRTQVPLGQFAVEVQELPALLPPEQAPVVAMLPNLLSQTWLIISLPKDPAVVVVLLTPTV
jgi:hypothetical protein